VLVLFVPFSAALANSMPGHWMSGKSGGSVFVLSGENLAVEHETLSFDIPQSSGMLDVANVSAQYHIQNEGEARTVTMLFPILFSIEDVGVMAEGMNVLVDSQPVPFSFAVLDTISGDYTNDDADIEALRESCSIENILAQMREKGITAGQFTPSEFLDKYNELYDMDYSSKLLLVMNDVSFEAGQARDVRVQYVQRATPLQR